jgi:hypothetical protein
MLNRAGFSEADGIRQRQAKQARVRPIPSVPTQYRILARTPAVGRKPRSWIMLGQNDESDCSHLIIGPSRHKGLVDGSAKCETAGALCGGSGGVSACDLEHPDRPSKVGCLRIHAPKLGWASSRSFCIHRSYSVCFSECIDPARASRCVMLPIAPRIRKLGFAVLWFNKAYIKHEQKVSSIYFVNVLRSSQ